MKTKLFTVATALCLLSITGCSNDETDDSDLQSSRKIQMTMQTSIPQTRADYTDNGTNLSFSWRSGDEISVIVNGVPGNENSIVTANADGKNVPFNGLVVSWEGKKNIYAFYPYSQSGYMVNGGDNSETATAFLTLPNPQSYTVGGAIRNSFIVGAGTATMNGTSISASASMKQVMSIIKLNISNAPEKVTGVKLKASEAIFPTSATVKLSDATITNPSGAVSELAMNVIDETTVANKEISLAMFPTNLTGKTIRIEVTFADGKVKEIVKTGTSFVRNKHYIITFDATGATAQYIEVAGIKWATGNLVADGTNGAKIGAPEDGGLYFRYGSLVGWSGGATGDGTGRGTNQINPALAVRVSPIGYTGSTTWGPWDSGDPTIENVAIGAGDPCRYYLKSTWRTPTREEYQALTANSGYPNPGPWKAEGFFYDGFTTSYATHTSGLKFPAAGSRIDSPYYPGALSSVGAYGFYGTTSAENEYNAYILQFHGTSLTPNLAGGKGTANPIRCVKD